MKVKKTLITLLVLGHTFQLAASPTNETQLLDIPKPVHELPPDNELGTTYQIQTVVFLGKFEATNLDEALDKNFIDESKLAGQIGDEDNGKKWTFFECNKERIKVSFIPFESKEINFFSIYFSFWIFSEKEIFYNENLRFYFYASSRAKLLLNGTEVNPTETIRVEKRIQYDYKKIEIKEGWNNFVIKLAGIPKSLEDTENEEASLAIRISGSVKLLDSLQFSPAQPK
jgi:hypothetical protein